MKHFLRALTAITLALSVGGGLLLGACITALGMKATGKRKDNKADATA